MIIRAILGLAKSIKNKKRTIIRSIVAVWLVLFVALLGGKAYQHLDQHESRGAIAVENGHFGESYPTPIYLDQGWDRSDSLWFYNTTQGSALLPYDFFLELELPAVDSTEKLRDVATIDKYRYLPQDESFFNPDGLPLGFVKDTYKGADYVGYTCAACHTGQVNYTDEKTNKRYAIRIDGGPAMADMVGFLMELEASMDATLKNEIKLNRFVDNVLKRNNGYSDRDDVIKDLEKWTLTMKQYNMVNESDVEYGYARLDAFGRIFNRVLQHVLNKEQAKRALLLAHDENGERILTEAEVELVLKDITDPTVIGNEQFALVLRNLMSTEPGYPGLDKDELTVLKDVFFNIPNAPVSYPFMWDITHSDYVQWNGLANNASVGPLGRNVGEVIGVFGILDWKAKDPGFSISAKLSGQSKNKPQIDFQSSIRHTNLRRLENQLKTLKSPEWPVEIFGELDEGKVKRGELIYAEYCQSCHEIIDRNNWDRIVIANMSNLDSVGTDRKMAENSVNYTGKSGNFKYTYQATDVGTIVLGEEAPVAALLTAATKGVVGTPEADKLFIRRWLDWLYNLASSFFENEIKASVKAGDYYPDTTAKPFNSLLSYKARSLNGIWATAPYLHNGSVPSLYDLLLPAKCDPENGVVECRPETFEVGSREFDKKRVGLKYEGYGGTVFDTRVEGNFNTGHEYAAGKTAQPNGEVLKPLNKQQRYDLLEFLKTL